MAGSRQDAGLEMDDEMEFQQRSWKVQRVSWLVMLLVVVAAALGLFGNGPLANATAGSKGSPLYIEYSRFVRQYAPQALAIEVSGAGITPDSTADVWLDRHWLAANDITSITPEPQTSWNDGDRTYYRFRMAPDARGSLFTIFMNNKAVGRRTGRVGMRAGPEYSFSQFAYP